MAARKPRSKKRSRGQAVIDFIESYCIVPDGVFVGKPMRLDEFQKAFILDVYDNPAGTRRAYLSIARKNGKTGLIAGILLAHVAGPEAVLNSDITSGAQSREQAAIVFSLAEKMVRLSPKLSKVIRIVPSTKVLIGLARNTKFRALSAEGKTAHGQSPLLAILDEVGQVRGPTDAFVDAIITAQGAHKHPLLIAISTQAPHDNDLFSIWIDDALRSCDPRVVCHLHTTPKSADLLDQDSWLLSNPALGNFRDFEDLKEQAERAHRMPTFEPTFRNLGLNQRVEMNSPYISAGVWDENNGAPDPEAFREAPVYVGIDLSGRADLTAMVRVAWWKGKWHVEPFFWTPEKGLEDRAKRDRAPYDVWAAQGFLRTTPGASVDYEVVARDVAEILEDSQVAAAAFDRWRFDMFKKELDEEGIALNLVPFGQGFKDMSPALDAMEAAMLNGQVAHGNHPVLTACAANARSERDAVGNRKLSKVKATGRIDGLVAMAMAFGVAKAGTAAAPPRRYQMLVF